MRPPYIFIATLFIGFSLNAQTASFDNAEPYDYDTTLKGGYTLFFKVDDKLQYLYLRKNGRTIAELASTSKGMPYKNLGYVGADFTDYFVLTHSFGSGNPHYIELIKKSTGKNILKPGAAWIDKNEQKQILLYSDNDSPSPKDKMTLYNIKTGQKKLLSFPSDIFGEAEILNRIEIYLLTDKQLVIKYNTKNGSLTRQYSR